MKDWTIGGDGWVTGKMFGVPVEKNEVKRPGGEPYLRLNESSKLGNLHTSEGVDVDNLVAFLKLQGYAGQWCVGEGRIVQTRPLWAQGSLLLGGSSTNYPMRMEVEQVAFSQYGAPWLPAPATYGPITALVAFYNVEFGIPLQRPVAFWKDDGSDISPGYYGPNSRRATAASIGLGNLQGWIHHCEVPQNLHADCGSYNRSQLFADAQKLVDSLNPPPPPEDDMTDEQAFELNKLHAFREGFLHGFGLTVTNKDGDVVNVVPDNKHPNWKAGDALGRLAKTAPPAAPDAPPGGDSGVEL